MADLTKPHPSNTQYQRGRAREMIEQTIYERCHLSSVQVSKDIPYNGHFHAGTVSHICVLKKNHKKEPLDKCKCVCGQEFIGLG